MKNPNKGYKKLKSREEKKKRMSKQTLMTIFIAAIMISSIAGFLYMGGGTQTSNYNGHKFKLLSNRMWETEVNGVSYYFYYLPEEVQNLNLNPDAYHLLQDSNAIGLTFNPKDKNIQTIDLLRYDLGISFSQLGKHLEQGMANNTNPAYTLPLMTCEDATPEKPVIYIRTSNTTGLNLDGYCAIMEGFGNMDMIAVRDRILYQMLGILQ
ncbi:hypothetical protein JW968_02850 [Candidatus Woesearchaeota archaeon]|nr:hypothetical protein [Candidatus Woesearchaeota archaeon]